MRVDVFQHHKIPAQSVAPGRLFRVGVAWLLQDTPLAETVVRG